jgi:hypothetical protein
MFLYLFLCGLAMAILAHDGTCSLLAARRERRMIRELQERFRREHPQKSDVVAYVTELRQELEYSISALGAIEDVLDKRTDVAAILLGLAMHLPREARLTGLTLDRKRRELEFAVATPLEDGTNGASPGDLIAAWHDEPLLTERVARISSISSERRTLAGQTELILSFSGTLGKQEI